MSVDSLFFFFIPIAQQEEMCFLVSSEKFHKIQVFDSIFLIKRRQNFKLAIFCSARYITHQEIPQKTEKSESSKKESS